MNVITRRFIDFPALHSQSFGNAVPRATLPPRPPLRCWCKTRKLQGKRFFSLYCSGSVNISKAIQAIRNGAAGEQEAEEADLKSLKRPTSFAEWFYNYLFQAEAALVEDLFSDRTCFFVLLCRGLSVSLICLILGWLVSGWVWVGYVPNCKAN